MGIQIRMAKESDIPAILDIYKPYVEGTAITFEYAVPSLDAFTKRFLSITKHYPYLVCQIDDEIAGYAYAGPVFERIAYQWNAELSIYLNPNYHKRRIGTALSYCLIDLLYLQGYYKLLSLITSENETSIQLHQKLGFTEFARFHNTGYKLGKWHDVTWMEKDLREYNDTISAPIPITELKNTKMDEIFRQYEILILKNPL